MNLLVKNFKKGEWVFSKNNGKLFAFIKDLKIKEVHSTIKEKNRIVNFDQNGDVVCFSFKLN